MGSPSQSLLWYIGMLDLRGLFVWSSIRGRRKTCFISISSRTQISQGPLLWPRSHAFSLLNETEKDQSHWFMPPPQHKFVASKCPWPNHYKKKKSSVVLSNGIISFNPHNNPTRWLLLFSPFYKWEDWGRERWSAWSQCLMKLRCKPTETGLGASLPWCVC